MKNVRLTGTAFLRNIMLGEGFSAYDLQK